MPTIAGNRSWDVAEHIPAGVTWETLDFPTWVRKVTLINQGTGLMYVSKGKSGAVGTPSGALILPSNGSVDISLTPGRQRATQAADLSVSVAHADGTGGSVGLLMVEAS